MSDGDVFFNEDQAFRIMEYLRPHFHFEEKKAINVYEECAGGGALMGAFLREIEKFHIVNSAEGHDVKDDGISALDIGHSTRYDVLIANPPWKESFAKPLYYKLERLLNDGGVMLFFINNVFLYQGRDRAMTLGFQKFYFLPRYVFRHSGRPLLDCGVAVQHKGPVPRDAAALRCFIDLPRYS